MKAKAYLSRANAYGGGSSDQAGNRPSLPVAGLAPPRPPAFSPARAQAQRAGSGTFGESAGSRAPGLPLGNACQRKILKPLLHPPRLPVTKDIKVTNVFPCCYLSSLVLRFSAPLTSWFRFLPRRCSLWAPRRRRATQGGAEPARSHGVLVSVVKVTRGPPGMRRDTSGPFERAE